MQAGTPARDDRPDSPTPGTTPLTPNHEDDPVPDTPGPSEIREFVAKSDDFRLRMALLDREMETALDPVADRYGRSVRPQEAAAIRARRTQRALDGYRLDLANFAGPLLAAARSALDLLPP